ncbi:hypothetical protein ADIARSV_1671 [Arcticibacter svalbardensis MN12-7]|uniref:Uncharacterized protein n=1 Tax=Arcticibacter svalbardensis MN12-7 TaxID=1150600 RepID=R9GU50_9SPHI|nr:hypothetical protein [Arcticibacter svalbardensis]EOR95183.1 hypothetical protein ADIARSV_1671 [Arcticibacter svalbardensis MN12-7]
MKKTILLLIIISTIISCKTVKPSAENNVLVLKGTVEKMGMSTFQYGTHLLKTESKTYALKTAIVKLDDYVGKEVSITGSKVEGYPVENGPDLIDVKKIVIK